MGVSAGSGDISLVADTEKLPDCWGNVGPPVISVRVSSKQVLTGDLVIVNWWIERYERVVGDCQPLGTDVRWQSDFSRSPSGGYGIYDVSQDSEFGIVCSTSEDRNVLDKVQVTVHDAGESVNVLSVNDEIQEGRALFNEVVVRQQEQIIAQERRIAEQQDRVATLLRDLRTERQVSSESQDESAITLLRARIEELEKRLRFSEEEVLNLRLRLATESGVIPQTELAEAEIIEELQTSLVQTWKEISAALPDSDFARKMAESQQGK